MCITWRLRYKIVIHTRPKSKPKLILNTSKRGPRFTIRASFDKLRKFTYGHRKFLGKIYSTGRSRDSWDEFTDPITGGPQSNTCIDIVNKTRLMQVKHYINERPYRPIFNPRTHIVKRWNMEECQEIDNTCEVGYAPSKFTSTLVEEEGEDVEEAEMTMEDDVVEAEEKHQSNDIKEIASV